MYRSNKKFKNRFLQASDNGIGYDCKFIVGSENVTIEGHKFMFSVASDVFKAMFYGELKEDDTVVVPDLDAGGFKGIWHFIYTGEAEFTSALHALSIYIAARKYLITELMKDCCKYIQNNIRPSEVLEFYEYCETNNIQDFEELCLKMIEEKTDEAVNSKYFPTVKVETIQLILKSRYLKLNSEIEVYDLFEKWALAEAARKQIGEWKLVSSFQNLKKCIRFLTITLEEFSSHIEHSLLLTEAEKQAIKCNLQELDSKPIPENLSVVKQQRNFFSGLSTFDTEFPISHIFLVRIDEPSGYAEKSISLSSERDIILVLRIGTGKFKSIDYLCSYVSFPSYNSNQGIFRIQSKVSVLAEDEFDDLVFTNESKIYHSESTKTGAYILAARVTLEELGSNFFLNPRRTQQRLISIQVQVNVIQEVEI